MYYYIFRRFAHIKTNAMPKTIFKCILTMNMPICHLDILIVMRGKSQGRGMSPRCHSNFVMW